MFRNRKAKPKKQPLSVYGSGRQPSKPWVDLTPERTLPAKVETPPEKVDLIDLAYQIKYEKDVYKRMRINGARRADKRAQRLKTNKLVGMFNKTVGFYSVDYL